MSDQNDKLFDDDNILLEERWQRTDGATYRLIIGKPIPFLESAYQCMFFVEGLYDRPKYHPQVSPVLSIYDAIRVAIRDLSDAGATPASKRK